MRVMVDPRDSQNSLYRFYYLLSCLYNIVQNVIGNCTIRFHALQSPAYIMVVSLSSSTSVFDESF